MRISERISKISPSMTLAITAKAKQMKSQGIDMVGFGAGEPDFDTADNVKQAALDAIKAGVTKYTPAAGSPELRQAVADKLKRENGLEYSPSQIIVSCGAKHSLYNTMTALINPGDEVIIPGPYWLTYPEQVIVSGGTPVYVIADESNGFRIQADMIRAKITDRTKAIVLNSPSNPSGAVIDEAELTKIAELAVEKGIFVISDEIYEKIIYDGRKHVSIASLGKEIKDITVVINGMSKSYSMTGWRLGYAAAPEDIAKAMSNLQSHSTSNPTSFAQKGGIVALSETGPFVKMMLESFTKRRELIVERLNSIEGLSCVKPDGAFYVFPSIKALIGKKGAGREILDAMSFTEYLLEEANVAVVPGNPFGAPNNIRMSYSTSEDNIAKGLDRIEAAIRKLA